MKQHTVLLTRPNSAPQQFTGFAHSYTTLGVYLILDKETGVKEWFPFNGKYCKVT